MKNTQDMNAEAARLDLIQIIMSIDADRLPSARKALEIVFSRADEELNAFELSKINIGLEQMKEGKTKSSEEVRMNARKALGI